MRKLTSIVALIIGLAFACSIVEVTGCKSTPNAIAYRTVGTTRVAVQTALKAWNERVKAGKTTIAQEEQVKAAYEKWQASMLVVIDAGKVYAAAVNTNAAGATGFQAALDLATAEAATNRADLLNLLTLFGVKL